LITGSPQFDTQDDSGRGDGVSTIQQWRRQVSKGHSESDLLDFDLVDIDPILANTVTRLRAVLGADRSSNGSVILSTTDLHDLTSFILHRLLSLPPFTNLDPQSISSSEGLRYGVLIYMLIIHGPTYYSHANILSALVLHLKYHLGQLLSSVGRHDFLPIWLLSVGALASLGTDEEPWFRGRCVEVSIPLGACRWDVIETYLKRVLWVQSSVPAFQHMWEDIIAAASSFSPEQHDQPDHFKGVA
jgi:hypothetical protein